MNAAEAITPPDMDHEHRVRLMRAMAILAGERGYAALTVADLVREAAVSKRSFYEHFASKEACFLALYRAASLSALRVLRQTVDVERPWQTQIETGLTAYFAHLSGDAAMLKTLFVEVYQLGEVGLSVRRETMQAMVDFMLATIDSGGVDRQPSVAIVPSMALAAVGGINELILRAIETGTAGDLAELTPCASELIRAVTRVELSDL